MSAAARQDGVVRELPALTCSAGVAVLGSQVVVHGKDLHGECLELGFVHYLLFCVTGRRFEPSQVGVLERLWVATGYPDARIWCNRIAGYMGSARVDPGLALSAALAASNSLTYGFQAMRLAYRVQASLPERIDERQRWLVLAIDERRVLHGYGRPVHGHDERIDVALETLVEAGLSAGPALRRAFWLDHELRGRKGIEMNIAGLWAAIAIDFGIDAAAYEAFMLLMFVPGYMAVYADQRGREPYEFLRGLQSTSSEPASADAAGGGSIQTKTPPQSGRGGGSV
jgi:citrate synthase